MAAESQAMLHVLFVTAERSGTIAPSSAGDGIELLRASGADDAVDRLSRASRIDAVVIEGPLAAEIAREIRREVPGTLPIAVVGEAPDLPGVVGWRRVPEGAALAAALRDLAG